LRLGNNQLTSVPGEIGGLVGLHTLSLHNNQLTSVPGEIWRLVGPRVLASQRIASPLAELRLSDLHIASNTRLPKGKPGVLAQRKTLRARRPERPAAPGTSTSDTARAYSYGIRYYHIWQDGSSSTTPAFPSVPSGAKEAPFTAWGAADGMDVPGVAPNSDARDLPAFGFGSPPPGSESLAAQAATPTFSFSGVALAGGDAIAVPQFTVGVPNRERKASNSRKAKSKEAESGNTECLFKFAPAANQEGTAAAAEGAFLFGELCPLTDRGVSEASSFTFGAVAQAPEPRSAAAGHLVLASAGREGDAETVAMQALSLEEGAVEAPRGEEHQAAAVSSEVSSPEEQGSGQHV